MVEHIGTARTDAELAVLMAKAHQRLHEGQETLDLEIVGLEDEGVAHRPGLIASKRSALLWQVLSDAYARLGFDAIADEAFASSCWRRSSSRPRRLTPCRVLNEIGVASASLRTMFSALQRTQEHDYRAQIASACFSHATAHGDVSLVVYDVTVRHEALVVRLEVRDLHQGFLP